MTIDYYESEKISVPYKYYFSTHFNSAASLGQLATVGDYLDPYLIATKIKMNISDKNVGNQSLQNVKPLAKSPISPIMN